MGSKQLLLAILVFILLSSTVIAVDFEWALGDSRTYTAYGTGSQSREDGDFTHIDINLGSADPRLIITKGDFSGGETCNSCGCDAVLKGIYQGKEQSQVLAAVKGGHSESINWYSLADSLYLGSYDGWMGACCPGQKWGDWCYWYSRWPRCKFVYEVNIGYLDAAVMGTDSVFTQSGVGGVKTLGTARSLYNATGMPYPTNGTIYLGIDEYDVMYWLGNSPTEPYNGIKEQDATLNSYVNVCADVDRNGECDYEDANRVSCENAGGAYYLKQGHHGRCCGPDVDQLYAATNIEHVVTCSYDADLQAFCGKRSDGTWIWAPEEDEGTVYDLLGCPGFSFVSDWLEVANYWGFHDEFVQMGCKGTISPGVMDMDVVNTPFYRLVFNSSFRKLSTFYDQSGGDYIPFSSMNNTMVISGTLGSHEYICSATGEIFECTGESAPYSGNPLYVAETGVTTNELIGAGGCPYGIQSYWSFDDSTATDTQASSNGIITGAANATGKISKALDFDGQSYVTIPGLAFSGNQISVETWIKPDVTTGATKYILNQGSVKIYIDEVNSQGQLYAHLNTDDGVVDFGEFSVFPNNWYHIALIYDKNANPPAATLYVNGFARSNTNVGGDIVPSADTFRIGPAFKGLIDDFAIYNAPLRRPTITRHYNNPNNYCAGTQALGQNYYCAADGTWTPDLDTKYVTSCDKAGYTWTGHYCCSEDDDPGEFYNDYNLAPANLLTQTVSQAAGIEINANQITLKQKGHHVTITGPAFLSIDEYSADATGIGPLCGKLNALPFTKNVGPGENYTVRVLTDGPTTDCPFKRKIITSIEIPSSGGCFNKTFIPRGTLMSPKVLNYEGTFYGCDLPANSPFLTYTDTKTNLKLIPTANNLQPNCNDIKEYAAGPSNHSVCGPDGLWQYTPYPNANFEKRIKWNATSNILSTAGCCKDDQCWDGNKCVDQGQYYTIADKTFICRD